MFAALLIVKVCEFLLAGVAVVVLPELLDVADCVLLFVADEVVVLLELLVVVVDWVLLVVAVELDTLPVFLFVTGACYK